MSFNFKTQLRSGQLGELLYSAAHPEYTRTDGMTCDFYTDAGKSIELKSDFYSVESTPNFFFERWSVHEKQKPGGPWQALGHGINEFAYFYVPSLVVYTFPVAELVTRLETLIPNIAPFPIKNQGFTTVGYRVARDQVIDLATVSKMTISLKSS